MQRLHTRLTIAAANAALNHFRQEAHHHDQLARDWLADHSLRSIATAKAIGYNAAARALRQLWQDLREQNRSRKVTRPATTPPETAPAPRPLVPYGRRRRNPTTHRTN